MTTPIAVFSLFVVQTAEEWLDYGLGIAKIAGLPVESWRVGDPTRSLYKYVAEALAARDLQDAEFVRAGFLSEAKDDWKTVVAREVYGVDRDEETFATPTVTITNGGGGYYPIQEGDLTVQASSTGKTYHNTDTHEEPGDVLSGGATITFTLVADEGGSDSNVAADEIDTIVSPALIGCTIDSSTAAVAADRQEDGSLETDCRETLGALSPNGPADAYSYVVRQEALTGVADIARSSATNDSTTGTVTVYVASQSGAVAGASVTAAQDAVETWANPLTMTPTVVNATATTVDLTATISGENIPADYETLIEDALAVYLSTTAISVTGRLTVIAVSKLYELIHATIPQATTVNITVPAADQTLSSGSVAVPGTVSVAEV